MVAFDLFDEDEERLRAEADGVVFLASLVEFGECVLFAVVGAGFELGLEIWGKEHGLDSGIDITLWIHNDVCISIVYVSSYSLNVCFIFPGNAVYISLINM